MESNTLKTGLTDVECSLLAAQDISKYLLLGMHHSTDEAKMKIAEIILEYIEKTTDES